MPLHHVGGASVTMAGGGAGQRKYICHPLVESGGSHPIGILWHPDRQVKDVARRRPSAQRERMFLQNWARGGHMEDGFHNL